MIMLIYCTGFGFGDDEYCYGHGADDHLKRSRHLTDQEDGGTLKHGGGDGSLIHMDGANGQQYDDGSGRLGRRRGTGTLGEEDGRGGCGDGEGGDSDGRDRKLGRDLDNKVCNLVIMPCTKFNTMCCAYVRIRLDWKMTCWTEMEVLIKKEMVSEVLVQWSELHGLTFITRFRR